MRNRIGSIAPTMAAEFSCKLPFQHYRKTDKLNAIQDVLTKEIETFWLTVQITISWICIPYHKRSLSDFTTECFQRLESALAAVMVESKIIDLTWEKLCVNASTIFIISLIGIQNSFFPIILFLLSHVRQYYVSIPCPLSKLLVAWWGDLV